MSTLWSREQIVAKLFHVSATQFVWTMELPWCMLRAASFLSGIYLLLIGCNQTVFNHIQEKGHISHEKYLVCFAVDFWKRMKSCSISILMLSYLEFHATQSSFPTIYGRWYPSCWTPISMFRSHLIVPREFMVRDLKLSSSLILAKSTYMT